MSQKMQPYKINVVEAQKGTIRYIKDGEKIVGTIFFKGVEQGYEWKVYRGGMAKTLEEAVMLATTSAWQLVDYLERQWTWSKRTFGPGKRTKGIKQHIEKELKEIIADPDDLKEWADVITLGLDGFWRHGGSPQGLIEILQATQEKNFPRDWPDWRGKSEDEAIEHDRSKD